METFSALLAPYKGQWHRTLLFSLIYAWTNGWANNTEASDLGGHGAYYDVNVVILDILIRKYFQEHAKKCVLQWGQYKIQ